MRCFSSFELHVIDNQNFHVGLSQNGRSISKLVQRRHSSNGIHIPMLDNDAVYQKACAKAKHNLGLTKEIGSNPREASL